MNLNNRLELLESNHQPKVTYHKIITNIGQSKLDAFNDYRVQKEKYFDYNEHSWDELKNDWLNGGIKNHFINIQII